MRRRRPLRLSERQLLPPPARRPVVVLVGAAALVVVLRRPAAALLALAGPATAAMLTEVVLKPLVGRRLDGGLAYPSGHTTASFSVALVVVVALLGAAVGPFWLRMIGAVAALGVAGAVGGRAGGGRVPLPHRCGGRGRRGHNSRRRAGAAARPNTRRPGPVWFRPAT